MKRFILIILILVVVGFVLMSRDQEEDVTENGVQENAEPTTEVESVGFGGVEMVVSPSEDKVVKGIVTINLTKIPDGTGVVAFGIYEQGNEDASSGPNLGLDTDGSDGWSYILDTTNYENGVYTIASIADESLSEGEVPLGAATARIIIEN